MSVFLCRFIAKQNIYMYKCVTLGCNALAFSSYGLGQGSKVAGHVLPFGKLIGE